MIIVVLWSNTKIGREICKIPDTIGISSEDFDTKKAKIFDKMDVLINCISEDDESLDTSIIYDTNVVGNKRMEMTAKNYDAHYIRISSHRIWNWYDWPYIEGSNTTGDGTVFGNTMCLSEYWLNYDRATIIRWFPSSDDIRSIIDNEIYGRINISWKITDWEQERNLFSNYNVWH